MGGDHSEAGVSRTLVLFLLKADVALEVTAQLPARESPVFDDGDADCLHLITAFTVAEHNVP